MLCLSVRLTAAFVGAISLRVVNMEPNKQITALIFSAFVKCPTKAYLLASCEQKPDTYFTEMTTRVSSAYKNAACRQMLLGSWRSEICNFEQLLRDQDGENTHYHVDCETVVYNLSRTKRASYGSHVRSGNTIPILFVPWEKPDPSDILLICFGALALAQVIGKMPTGGTLIYGDSYRHKTVNIESHVTRTRQIIDAIMAPWREQKPPAVVLNRHCAVCDFQPRCRGIATERDDLSLLTAMTVKERAKCAAKGIFTITQLSYGYRPRRRKRIRPDAQPSKNSAKRPIPSAKNDFKLKALAIKKSQIHVIGAPSLKFVGVPTFLDVEGMPDRDFYYLIGLRFESHGVSEERSFWADRADGEREIWESCLLTLKSIENAQIVSYGAYETRFLKRMRERYVREPDDVEFVEKLIKTSVNLVSHIFGRVYFPTYTNGLKDVARYLGFEWTWPHVSGAAAPFLRRYLELSTDERHKRELIDYNMSDCGAAAKVAGVLEQIYGNGASDLNAVNVSSLEVSFQRTFGKLECALPEFKKINDAAYWDYQRSKVYTRTDKTIRRSVRQTKDKRKNIAVQKEVMIGDVPSACPSCNSESLAVRREGAYIVYDLKFMKNGIKRWFVRYKYARYKCSKCRSELTTYLPKPLYGPNLRAFVIYLMIELRLSNQKAAEHASMLFDLPLTAPNAQHIKSSMAEKFEPTYRTILKQIANGSLIHADETKGVVHGGGHYMWVFTNMTTVAYAYSESREATILEELLHGFKGVLVSDFYAAYDSVPCAQQKCLIHLMRDINEDLHRNPFDEELKEIAKRFGVLLREIVATIDKYGLKSRHLGKHRQSADKFLDSVSCMACVTEAASALKKRFEKNRGKLFTFLEYDGVPWNNNNAEHAVKAFTRIRNMMSISTPKGHRDYATLLSIQQTLRYRNLNFLEFLRSGRIEID
jgi:predicted RecB family nuclease